LKRISFLPFFVIITLVALLPIMDTVDGLTAIIKVPETAKYETCLVNDNCLQPFQLTICKGARVTWLSDGYGSISLQSGHVEESKGEWIAVGTEDFGVDHAPADQGYTHRFEQSGMFEYFLIPHLHAQGKVTVLESCNFSPLKQYQSGIQYHDIFCKDGFELVGKRTNGTPACVKNQSVEDLVYRGWATSDRVYPLTNPQTYLLTANKETFPIEYTIDGSALSEIIYDKDANSIIIQLEDTIGGNLVISIPRDIIDATFGDNEDDVFFVLVDGMEVAYGETSDDQERTLTILLPRESSTIEIIGTYGI